MSKTGLFRLTAVIGAVTVGVMIAVTSAPPSPVLQQSGATSTVSAIEATPIVTNLRTNAPLRPWLRKYAVVDLSRLLAAHPRASQAEEIRRRLVSSGHPSGSKEAKNYDEWITKSVWAWRKAALLPDIQRIVAERAQADQLTFVLDSSAVPDDRAPFPIYGAEVISFDDIVNAREVKDITFEVLKVLTNRPAVRTITAR